MNRPTLWRSPGLQLKPLYQANDIARVPHLQSLPGKPPFLRGPYASMYSQRPWTIRQYSGFANPGETNQRLRQQLANGAQGLSIAFDLPTHRGYDSDEPSCSADVGMAGVAIDSVEDMHALFAGIALDLNPSPSGWGCQSASSPGLRLRAFLLHDSTGQRK